MNFELVGRLLCKVNFQCNVGFKKIKDINR